jgi:hypothetical protein
VYKTRPEVTVGKRKARRSRLASYEDPNTPGRSGDRHQDNAKSDSFSYKNDAEENQKWEGRDK